MKTIEQKDLLNILKLTMNEFLEYLGKYNKDKETYNQYDISRTHYILNQYYCFLRDKSKYKIDD